MSKTKKQLLSTIVYVKKELAHAKEALEEAETDVYTWEDELEDLEKQLAALKV